MAANSELEYIQVFLTDATTDATVKQYKETSVMASHVSGRKYADAQISNAQ